MNNLQFFSVLSSVYMASALGKESIYPATMFGILSIVEFIVVYIKRK